MGSNHSLVQKHSNPVSSHVSKETIHTLSEKSHFTLKELEKLVKAFEDRAEGGTEITKQEFIEILQTHVNCWSLGAQFMFMDRLFNVFDTDGSGTIDFIEFIEGLSVFLRGTPDEKTESLFIVTRVTFRLYDIDKSGSIEPKELIKVMGQMYSAFYNEDQTEKIRVVVQRIFDDLDINGDGSLSLTEFKLMALKEPMIVDFLEQFLKNTP